MSLHAAGAQGALDTVTTGPTGTYAFADRLASGNVKVLAHDPSGDHLDEWFDGAGSHATATAIDVPGGGSTTADIALALTPGIAAAHPICARCGRGGRGRHHNRRNGTAAAK